MPQDFFLNRSQDRIINYIGINDVVLFVCICEPMRNCSFFVCVRLPNFMRSFNFFSFVDRQLSNEPTASCWLPFQTAAGTVTKLYKGEFLCYFQVEF